ncbi:hypothetical protein [Paenibacillus pini]|uniref:N-acyl-D-glucosamine 2-epimerase-like protein n=1 Tax=Paenibacillus pini JCM 16418 TaxID=1236976 RepID=W7YCC7_9BACL|nr:hypothetical protein [Paenibacillus pini]GAF08565.1 N-acyl-D-glucosamine 2-epimerase-like protein [Paenibacillus pini JCM 16418]
MRSKLDNQPRTWALGGPSIQIDPLFPYYLGRTADSIAEEIELAGYQTVHYFVVNENGVNAELLEALHARGIAVWALVIGNGTFSTSHLPPEWQTWRMGLVKELNDGFVRFSPLSKDYVAWKKQAVAKLLQDHPFDGIEIAEPYFPEWDGIRRGVYGDIGIHAQQAFREQYDLEIPDFHNKRSSNYYKKVPETYTKWISFRVDAVNGLIDEIINGVNGARSVRPDIMVATWSLAVDGGAVSTLRLKEWQGLDAISMIERVKPDMHVLQTHWPDWMRRNLQSNYVRAYEGFAAPIRSAFPGLPLAIQADIGSKASMVKNRSWLNEFQNTVYELGYDSWTAYEYHLGSYMYEESPEPLRAVLQGETQLVISFNKRIDPEYIGSLLFYTSEVRGEIIHEIQIEERLVDGNRIVLRLSNPPKVPFAVEVSGVKDTPDLWFIPGKKANEIREGIRLMVVHET